MTKKSVSEIEEKLGVKIDRTLRDKVAKLTGHSNGSMLDKHYDKN